mmetsp:Transcript_126332/g.252431  ORF Transcript_126332/g.252431 Transcript_126332/m.252431 type:complete len:340 (+) Transcript_126332:83-1102(+)|eukprot:CAMPEP_0172675578 /NCGR_PEP_ID=MMETSP1074-20121228/13349_1 /TAXON_ID=2916 /ORGANISM="Ceratium fusus, Strain PA161109" /LENGTH=339 /DNA_ID=CAMNT_0013493051 /DNA_START=96 /DNA_END=1115 /DNA_ORIENTATION=-
MVLPNTVVGLARPGADVPGYKGYISGKKPEADLLGGTFRADNENAAKGREYKKSGRTHESRRPQSAENWCPRRARDAAYQGGLGTGFRSASAAPIASWEPAGHRQDGTVPGYSGHLPGKLEDVYGATFSASNLYATAKREGEVRPGETHFQPSQPLLGSHVERRKPEAGGHAIKAIPNYAGFIPSKRAENIISKSWRPANWEAAAEFSKTRSGGATSRGWRTPQTVSTASSVRGSSGYRQRPGTALTPMGSRSARSASRSSGSLRGTLRPASSRSASYSGISDPSSRGVYDYSKSGLPGRLKWGNPQSSARTWKGVDGPHIPGYSGHMPQHRGSLHGWI